MPIRRRNRRAINSDIEHDRTDRIIESVEQQINRIYVNVGRKSRNLIQPYLNQYTSQIDDWQNRIINGLASQTQYNQWLNAVVFGNSEFISIRNQISSNMVRADADARAIVSNVLPEVFANNFNYSTYIAESSLGLNTSFALYDASTVRRLVQDNPQILPPLNPLSETARAIREGRLQRWNNQQVTSQIAQAIRNGESVSQITDRFDNLGSLGRGYSYRYARTSITNTENAGRYESMNRLSSLGIKCKKQWLAVNDDRTRHEHRVLDGQIVPYDEPFEVDGFKINYPADESAEAFLVYNCRCTMLTITEYDREENYPEGVSYNPNLLNMSYEEWQRGGR